METLLTGLTVYAVLWVIGALIGIIGFIIIWRAVNKRLKRDREVFSRFGSRQAGISKQFDQLKDYENER